MGECAGKGRRIPAAAKVTRFIPAEIWTEILARLPVKSVLRFRCVSKSFLDIIDNDDDDPNFVAMHLNLYKNNRQRSRLLPCERGGSNRWTPSIRRSHDYSKHVCDQVPQQYNSTSICNSVNGLILMKKVGASRLTLCNPSLRKSLLLPILPFSLDITTTTTTYSCAFLGYIPSINAYKVVAFQFPNDNSLSNLTIAVHNVVRDGFWRMKTDFMDVPSWWLLKNKHECVCSNQGGYVSWLVQDPDLNPNRSRISCRYTHIVSFDFEKETFSLMELPMPDNDHDREMWCFLFPHGRSVGLFSISLMRSCLWLMKKDNGGKEFWTKLYSGGSSSDACAFFAKGPTKIGVYMEESDKFFVLKYGSKLRSYDIRNYGVKYLSNRRLVNYIGTYLESLVLSRGFEGLTISFP